MSSLVQYNNLYFLTGTIHQWHNLLASDDNKYILLDSLLFLTKAGQGVIYAFVILDNHIHVLFEVIPPFTKSKLLYAFFSHTSKELLRAISEDDKQNFRVHRSNKKLQIWKPNSLCVEIITQKFLRQKINYIHKNVERQGLDPDSYAYSSWPSYRDGSPKFDFVTLWGG